jgi:RimJ/RimL family protein N-acetyltransferase
VPSNHAIPTTLRTARLVLRAWTPDDADTLAPILEANAARLAPWLPARVATPAPSAALRERLAGYAADFAAGRALRYAVRDAGESTLLGGADIHPRSAAGRVPLPDASCAELGYWLAESAEGHGFAMEASRALLDLALTIPVFQYAEARVDPRNARSAAVARRLGFRHAESQGGVDVWRLPLDGPTR